MNLPIHTTRYGRKRNILNVVCFGHAQALPVNNMHQRNVDEDHKKLNIQQTSSIKKLSYYSPVCRAQIGFRVVTGMVDRSNSVNYMRHRQLTTPASFKMHMIIDVLYGSKSKLSHKSNRGLIMRSYGVILASPVGHRTPGLTSGTL